jgi:hypothetical protein
MTAIHIPIDGSFLTWEGTSPVPAEPDPDAILRETVEMLVQKWRHDTGDISSGTERLAHPAYRAVVGLGTQAVPHILRELRRDPNDWFSALREITHENPVTPNQRGDVHAMADAWIKWGEAHGFSG